MKLLLDTHIFLWFISGSNQLSAIFRDSIQNPNNTVYLSVVSLWERIIKYQLGKLPLPESPEIYLPKQREQHRIDSLTVDEASVAQLIKLPSLHRDPFDRLLICQSLQHNLTVTSHQLSVTRFQVSVVSFCSLFTVNCSLFTVLSNGSIFEIVNIIDRIGTQLS